jgi:hypothetical protein
MKYLQLFEQFNSVNENLLSVFCGDDMSLDEFIEENELEIDQLS